VSAKAKKNKERDNENLLEALSALEHSQWLSWRAKLEKQNPEIPRSAYLNVPYSKLSESEKEEDRKWARKVIAILKQRGIRPEKSSKAKK
jgi:hypothetical protein